MAPWNTAAQSLRLVRTHAHALTQQFLFSVCDRLCFVLCGLFPEKCFSDRDREAFTGAIENEKKQVRLFTRKEKWIAKSLRFAGEEGADHFF